MRRSHLMGIQLMRRLPWPLASLVRWFEEQANVAVSDIVPQYSETGAPLNGADDPLLVRRSWFHLDQYAF